MVKAVVGANWAQLRKEYYRDAGRESGHYRTFSGRRKCRTYYREQLW